MGLKQLIAVVACSTLLGACADEVDRAAKKRIFSAEDPPQAITAAAERLPPENVADDPKVTRRIVGMGAAEATERLGPHKYSATVSFEWTGNDRSVRLSETRTLLAGRGGVAGDFQGTIENSRDQGLEVVRVGGQVFARSRHGTFRQRLRDRGIAERTREEIYGAVKELDALFQGRLLLTPQGTVSYEGRTAWKYAVSLGPPSQQKQASNLPPVAFAKGGADQTTRHRLAFFEQRAPTSLQGELFVDAESSVVLKARLDGRLSVAADAGEAGLHMVVEVALTQVGQEPKIAAPEKFLPDEDKPAGIAVALDRFGIPRAGKLDAGTAELEADDE